MCQTLIYFRLDNLVRFFFVSPDGFYAGTLKAFQKNQYGVLVSPFYLITLYNNITALVIIIVCITLWCNLKRHVRAIEIIAEHRFKRFLVSASISPIPLQKTMMLYAILSSFNYSFLSQTRQSKKRKTLLCKFGALMVYISIASRSFSSTRCRFVVEDRE